MSTLTIDSGLALEELTASGLKEKEAQAIIKTFQNASLENAANKEDLAQSKHCRLFQHGIRFCAD